MRSISSLGVPALGLLAIACGVALAPAALAEPPRRMTLRFTLQPSDTRVAEPIQPAVRVELRDPRGRLMTRGRRVVRLTLGRGPSGATLSGTLERRAVGGVAVFDDLQLDGVGPGCTLVASARGASPAESAAFEVLPQPPLPAANLSGAATSTGAVMLAWTDASPNEDGFRVERRLAGGGAFASIALVPADSDQHLDGGAILDAAYEYRVVAFNRGGEAPPSNVASVATPPTAPTQLTALSPSFDRIELTWTDTSTSELGFRVERRVVGGAFQALASTGPDSSRFVDRTGSFGQTYEYRLLAVGAGGDSSPSNLAAVTADNRAPTLSVSPGELNAGGGQPITFSVSASDADGDPIDVALSNPPPGILFEPAYSAGSPVVREARGHGRLAPGSYRLEFTAADGRATTRVAVVVRVAGTGVGPGASVAGDVTGDGQPDVVVGARLARIAGVSGVGAIHVWEGAPQPGSAPAAVLSVPGATALDWLARNDGTRQTIHLEDVTGDGVLDVVALAIYADVAGVEDAGAIYVWAGGGALRGEVAPTATLVVAGGLRMEAVGRVERGQGLSVRDVTGDGVLDVIAAAPRANDHEGAVYVWAGGSLAGTTPPLATLRSGTGQRGFARVGNEPFYTTDLTQDGVLDLLVPAVGPNGAGQLYLWAGGGALSGVPAPLSLLADPAAPLHDANGAFASVQFADVTGDGLADVISHIAQADVDGVLDAGQLLVWVGRSQWTALAAPTALLARPNPIAGDQLGGTAHVVDLTGDGVLDLVVPGPQLTVAGTPTAGGLLIWEGGAGLAGRAAPRASLSVPGGQYLDHLGGGALFVADVTGDGLLDVVAGSHEADLGPLQNTGAVYVWSGASGLQGDLAPTATLRVTGAAEFDELSATGSPRGLQLADVDGDGCLDLLAASRRSGYGAIYVWRGGAALSGAPSPTAVFEDPAAGPYADLGRLSPGLVLHDFDRDGDADVLVDTSAGLLLFAGQPGLAGSQPPTAILAPRAGNGPAGVQLGDVTGDGRLDVISAAWDSTLRGLIRVWSGDNLIGTPAPVVTLAAPTAIRGDLFQQVQLVDLSGDGRLDVIGIAPNTNVSGKIDCGALEYWEGGPTLSGSGAPDATLTPQVPMHGYRLGSIQ